MDLAVGKLKGVRAGLAYLQVPYWLIESQVPYWLIESQWEDG